MAGVDAGVRLDGVGEVVDLVDDAYGDEFEYGLGLVLDSLADRLAAGG